MKNRKYLISKFLNQNNKITKQKNIKLININFIALMSFSIISMVSLFTKTYAVYELSDISNHWAKNEIQTLLKENVVNGYSDNTFRPNDYVTISEFLKMLIELSDYKLVTIGNKWPDWYIETALSNNLILENEFKDYSSKLTRGESAKIIGRYINLDDVKKGKNSFKDLKGEEKDIVLKLVNLGIFSGYSDKTFKSEKQVTRAESCKIILSAYNAKQELLKTRKYKITSNLTNLKDDNLTEKLIENRYEIKDGRLYFYDENRYAFLNGQTLNQEYINDKKVINLIEKLINNESYVEVKFVPDKYIINSLNIWYGNSEADLYNGAYNFEIKLYENAYYNVASSKDNEKYMEDAIIKIKLGKMWDKHFELESESSCSEKNLYKLGEAIGILLDNNVKDEFIKYIKQKRIEASNLPNTEEPKIAEIKKIGKYTINTFCFNDNDIEIYIEKF